MGLKSQINDSASSRLVLCIDHEKISMGDNIQNLFACCKLVVYEALDCDNI